VSIIPKILGRDGIGTTRCCGCHEPLTVERRELGYCGQRCRRVARVIEKAHELDQAARARREAEGDTPEVRAAYDAADAKWRAAYDLKRVIHEGVTPGS
jgi:hypothetical protein